MEKELVKLAYALGHRLGMEKSAGPSLRDKALAGVPGAEERLRRAEAVQSAQRANPSPLGSLNGQKAYIQREGKKLLSAQSPETRERFRGDARRFHANTMRARAFAGSFLPGLGLPGASALLGAAETGASAVSGIPVREALARGASTAGGALALGAVTGKAAPWLSEQLGARFGRNAAKAMAGANNLYVAKGNFDTARSVSDRFRPVFGQ